MGGCRCTYKNCTLRTDGVTHMFHYPVFDKIRCHQWLTNAEKLEFLNLKVSQLKNRVVCQHHFRDDNFMNFLKDKLTFEAVPTLDGPFCDSSQSAGNKPEDDTKLYCISLEDIENDYLTFNDKKANFSVKYGDFLTNCDLMDLDSMNLTNDNTQITIKDRNLEEPSDIILNEHIDRYNAPANSILNKTLDILQSNNNDVLTVHVSEVPITIHGDRAEMQLPSVNVAPTSNVCQTVDQKTDVTEFTNRAQTRKRPRILLNEKNKITILNERSIPKSVPPPVQFPVKLEPVSPTAILTLPNKKRNLNMNLRSSANNVNPVINDVMEISNIPQQTVSLENDVNSQTVIISENQSKINNEPYSTTVPSYENQEAANKSTNNSPQKEPSNKVNRINTKKSNNSLVKNRIDPEKTSNNSLIKNRIDPEKKSNNSLIKNRIDPERMAAIEEKRKFNMKLRDIIASCLDKLDDEEPKSYENCKSKIKNKLTQNVSSYLSKEPELPGIQDYTVAYLEARMKRMENILLNKIDQNTQRILDLKELLTPKPEKKVVQTQTVLNEEIQKKQLYQEISKFLSPEANSLLYEELFINKYGKNITQKSPTKKRKYR